MDDAEVADGAAVATVNDAAVAVITTPSNEPCGQMSWNES